MRDLYRLNILLAKFALLASSQFVHKTAAHAQWWIYKNKERYL